MRFGKRKHVVQQVCVGRKKIDVFHGSECVSDACHVLRRAGIFTSDAVKITRGAKDKVSCMKTRCARLLPLAVPEQHPVQTGFQSLGGETLCKHGEASLVFDVKDDARRCKPLNDLVERGNAKAR